MTACIPDYPAYCFYLHAGEDGEPPQIRIPFEGFAFAIPTALVVLNRADGLAVRDRLNRALGLDRAAWTALAAHCLRTGGGDPESDPRH